MRLDLLSLRIFLTVVEEGNLTPAAEREHIAASAISKRIQDLEALFETRLLNRNIRGVIPTEAGATLAQRARGLLSMVEEIRGDLSEHTSGAVGEVSVHANGSAIAGFLTRDLTAFMGRHPGLRVDLHEGLSPNVLGAVNQGHAHIGVFARTFDVPKGLTIFPYRTDRLLAVVAADHPLAAYLGVTFAELLEFDQVGIAEGSSLSRLLQRAAEDLGRKLRFCCTVNTNEAVRWMVGAGFGVAVLPEGFVRPYEAAMEIRGIPLEEAWARRELSLAVRDPLRLMKPARLLLQALRTPPGRLGLVGDPIPPVRASARVGLEVKLR